MNAVPPLQGPLPVNSPGIPMFFRIGAVVRLTGLGRSTIYRLIAQDAFPQPIRLTQRRVGWRPEDLDRWREQRLRASH